MLLEVAMGIDPNLDGVVVNRQHKSNSVVVRRCFIFLVVFLFPNNVSLEGSSRG